MSAPKIAPDRCLTENCWHPPEQDWVELDRVQGTAHETGGVLRAFRAGLTGSSLLEATGTAPHEAMDLMKLAMGDETLATGSGREVYDGRIHRCPKCGGPMYKAPIGAAFQCPVDFTNHYPKDEKA